MFVSGIVLVHASRFIAIPEEAYNTRLIVSVALGCVGSAILQLPLLMGPNPFPVEPDSYINL